MTALPFSSIALIGLGLVGSSLARKIKAVSSARVLAYAPSSQTRQRARELGLVDKMCDSLPEAVAEADCVVLCSPPSTFGALAKQIVPHLKKNAILSDVGSFKVRAIEDIKPHLDKNIFFVPAHPIAGTEHSGIDAGFATLFENRWCIITPLQNDANDKAAYGKALDKVEQFWQALGSSVVRMEAAHHDRVLALTSHLPHIIAWTMIATSQNLTDIDRKEVIDYSGGGFKDFTRLASSDPLMWRDVLLGNQAAVLEMIDRFTKELTLLRDAIDNHQGDVIQELFGKLRDTRALIIEAEKKIK